MINRARLVICGLLMVTTSLAAQGDALEKAKAASQKGQHAEALAILDEAYGELKDNPDALELMAQCAFNTGDLSRCCVFALRLVEKDKTRFAGHKLAAQAFYWRAEAAKQDPTASGKVEPFYEESVFSCDQGLKLKPDDRELLILKGHDLYWLSRHKESAAAFKSALESDPENVELRGFMLRGYAMASDLEGLDKWLADHPKDATAWWWRGYAGFQKGDLKDAAKSYEKSWEVSGETLGSAARSAGDAHWRMGSPADAQGMPQYDKANKDELKLAFKWFAKAQAVKNWNWGANSPASDMVNLFVGLQQNGHLDFAAKQVEEVCLPSAPKNWRLLNILGLYYRDKGGIDRSAEGAAMCKKSANYYEAATKSVVNDPNSTGPEKAQILNDTGVLFHWPQYRINDMDKGIEFYRLALSYDATYVDANENMGICMNELGKYEEAIPYLEKVLEVQPNRPVARRQLARAKKGLNKK